MKKILSLTLAVLMVMAMIPTAFATTDHSNGTQITVVGAGGEYSVTVPATLEPGQTGKVTASGYWSKDQMLTVTTPKTVEVTNTKTNQTATINVSFAGIVSTGNDIDEMNIPVDISIDTGNTKFGTWTGVLTYEVTLENVSPVTIGSTEYYFVDGVTWGEWVDSVYNTDGFIIDDTNVIKTAEGYRIRYNTSTVKPSDVMIADAVLTIDDYL